MAEMAVLNPVEDTAVTDGSTDNGTDMLLDMSSIWKQAATLSR